MSEFLDITHEYGPYVARGVGITMELTAISMAISLAVGLLVALALLSRIWPVVIVMRIYVEVARGIPPIVQLFIVYFGLASAGLILSSFVAAFLTFGFIGGAYLAEIFRAGINAVDRGQVEAAKALGMSYATTMRRVVVPQATRIVLPPIANQSIDMLKATAVVVTIGVADITFRAYNVSSTTFRSMEILILAGIIYLCLSYPMSLGTRLLERRLSRDLRHDE